MKATKPVTKHNPRPQSGNEAKPRSLSGSQDSSTRPVDARKLLTVLRAARTQQDLTAQPERGRGIWLSSQLWQSVTKQLELQVSETETLQKQLRAKEQDSDRLRRQIQAERDAHDQVLGQLREQTVELRGQAEEPLAELKKLQAQVRAKEEAWAQHKQDLEAQADRLLKLLRGRQDLLTDNEGLQQLLEAAQTAQAAAERRAAEAEAQATELRLMREYTAGKAEAGVTERDVQALRIRELSAALSEARHRAESYRRQLAARTSPVEELTQDLQRLKADNRRLVALLSAVPEYRSMAAEMAGGSGLHYMPLEECLMAKGLVDDLHPQLLDRPVQEVEGGMAAPGGSRDPDAPDPSLAVVLDEQYHWVPRAALEAGSALMRRMMPALPTSQLLALVAELNKVWRDRERQRLAEVAAAHREELRKLQHTFQQRAPYEAVVASQKITDLKRRMRVQAAQAAAAAAAAKGEHKRTEDDSKVLLHAGLSSIQDLSHQVARLLATRKRPSAGKAVRQRAAKKKGKEQDTEQEQGQEQEQEQEQEEPQAAPGNTDRCAPAASDASRQQHASPRPSPSRNPRTPAKKPAPKYLTSALGPGQPHQPASPPPRGAFLTAGAAPDEPSAAAAAAAGASPTASWASHVTPFTDGNSYRHEESREQLKWLGEWCGNGGGGGGGNAAAGGSPPPHAAAMADARTAAGFQPPSQLTHGSSPSPATAVYGNGPVVRVNVIQSPQSSSAGANTSVWRQRDAAVAATAAAAASGAAGAPTAPAGGAAAAAAGASPHAGTASPCTAGGGSATTVAVGSPTRHVVTATTGCMPDSLRITTTSSTPRQPMTVHLETSPAGLTLVAAPAASPPGVQDNGTSGVGVGLGGFGGGGSGGGGNYGSDGGAGAGPEASAASLADWRNASGAKQEVNGSACAGEGAASLSLRMQLGGNSPSRAVLPTVCEPQRSGAYAVGIGAAAGGGGVLQQQLQLQLQQQRGMPVRVSVRFPRQDLNGGQP